MTKINHVYFTDGMSCMVTPMADFVEALKGQGWQRMPMGGGDPLGTPEHGA